MRFLRISSIFLLALIVVGSIACNRQKATIVPKIQINKRSAEMGTPIEVSYSFATKQDYVALFKDMTVFVHFIDPKRVRRFQDDHLPPMATSSWRPGGNYNYTRTVFIPKNIPAGEYKVVVGIYSPSKGQRVPLDFREEYGNRSYDMGTLLIEIPPQEPVIQYASGWYDPESQANDIGINWRWTKKEAVLKVRNPRTDALLYLKVDGVPERFPNQPPQQLTVLVNNNPIETLSITTNQPVSKKYNVAQNLLGNEKLLEIKLQVDKTFTPAEDKQSRDTRELGVRVYQLYLGRAAD